MINAVESEIHLASPTKQPRNTSYHAIRPSLAIGNTPRATVFRRHSAEVPPDSQVLGPYNASPNQLQQDHESTGTRYLRSNVRKNNHDHRATDTYAMQRAILYPSRINRTP